MKFKEHKEQQIRESVEQDRLDDSFEEGSKVGANLIANAIIKISKVHLATAVDDEEKALKDFINSLAQEFQRLNTKNNFGVDPRKFAQKATK